MSKRIKHFGRSLRRAGKGLALVWRTESNFRWEIVIAMIVIAAMLYWQVTLKEAIILILIITLVLILEIINSVLERVMDILKPKISAYVAVLKDMMAATVLLASICAIIIGLFIFLPYIF
ncbi:MAG: diacylglycerol kinase [Candidatus Komeilibacteria bacterium]